MKKIRPWHFIALTMAALIFSVLTAPAYAASYLSYGASQNNYNVQAPYDAILGDTSDGMEWAVGLDLPPKWLTFEIAMSDNGESTKTLAAGTYELDSQSVAFFFHPQYQIGTFGNYAVMLHARAGYSITTFEVSEPGLSYTDTDIHPAYGLGLSLHVNPTWSIELDYLQRQHTATFTGISTDLHMEQYILKLVLTL